ncbi:hypothetical protein EDC01DRAFT_638556 [Geopyxis carbonaria]|nr:hypothetical protein EDC01DRAFT_638556 [Geopyxis carbonaria]
MEDIEPLSSIASKGKTSALPDAERIATINGTHSPLLRLPNELLTDILELLSTPEHLRLELTCSRLREFASKFLYARLPLAYYGYLDGSERLPQSPFSTLAVLKAILNPQLAKYVQFIDHVDQPLPQWKMSVEARTELSRAGENGAPLIGRTKIFEGWSHRPAVPKEVVEQLKTVLEGAMGELRTVAKGLHTIRIVHGSKRLLIPLLELAFDGVSVRKLWIEDPPLPALVDFNEGRNEIIGEWQTGLTHVRIRGLRVEHLHESLGAGVPEYSPEYHAIAGFMKLVFQHSPNLTSISLDAIHNLECLPAILEPCTFPHLTSFQIRSQTDNYCNVPFYLTDPLILSFMTRHAPRLKALAWPAEFFISRSKEAPTLDHLLQLLSRNLVWLRTDCALLSSHTSDGQSRYDGAPLVSRYYLAYFIRNLPKLATLKLQGDFQDDELISYFNSLTHSLTALSVIRGNLPLKCMAALVANAPNIESLKFCSYFSPGLVSFYSTAILGYTTGDDVTLFNITLEDFLETLASFRHLRTLTLPCAPGLDIDDAVVAGIWDSYRASRPGGLKVFIDTKPEDQAPTQTTDENGIVSYAPSEDPDIEAVQPANIVAHIVKYLPPSVRNVRLFFILNVVDEHEMDCHEFCVELAPKNKPKPKGMGKVVGGQDGSETLDNKVDTLHRFLPIERPFRLPSSSSPGISPSRQLEWVKVKGHREVLEVCGTPTLAYAWGTKIWNGAAKDLSRRAWF